jgi:hypothetical protein
VPWLALGEAWRAYHRILLMEIPRKQNWQNLLTNPWFLLPGNVFSGIPSQRRFLCERDSLMEGPAQARSSRYLWHRWALTPAVLRLAWCDNFSDFVDPTEPARSFFVSKFFSLSANSVSKIKVSANFVSKFLLSANQIVVSKFCKQISKFDCRKQIVSAIQQIAP